MRLQVYKQALRSDHGIIRDTGSIAKSGEAPRPTTNTNAGAPSHSESTSRDVAENSQQNDTDKKGEERLAPGQSPTPPGEVRPGHNPEKP
jgi:hypothetical protein